MRFFTVLLTGALLLGAAPLPLAADEPPPRPLRFPDIHGDFVVFAYAGDIWRAPSAGGEARRLTSHAGLELFPRISPDGKWVAFSGEYSGARQVYVMPAAGGTPEQLTFYTDVGQMPPRGGWDYWIQGWTPDGKILVRCNRTPWGERMGRYCLVDPAGGLETYLPLPEGGSASLSPDGKSLAYTPVQREFRTWKRTRGGRAQDVWIYDLENAKSRRLTTDHGTDNQPMWAGDTIYFTSDRENTLNLYAYDLGDDSLRKVTDFSDYDILWPQLGRDAIVFLKGGHLYRFDLASEETRRIDVEIKTELPVAVPQWISVADNVNGATLSPGGKRVVIDARGELWSVPKKHGATYNLTRSAAVRERDPVFSPDGKWVAYFSDASGEYELYVRPAEPGAEGRQITRGSDIWIAQPAWSPDSTKIAWNDQNWRLRFAEVESGDVTDVDRGNEGAIFHYVWSPDSQWLAYNQTHPSHLPGMAVYSLDSGESMLLGDGLTPDFQPAWSADGQYLFFLSNRDYQLRFSDFEFDFLYDRSTSVYVAALDPAAPALFPPRNDEEKQLEESADVGAENADSGKGKKGGKKGTNGDEENGEDKAPITVEPRGFVARTIGLPGLRAGNYNGLQAIDGALFYLRQLDGDNGNTLVRYDLEQRKEETVLEGVQAFELTPDGKLALVQARGDWSIIDAKPGQNGGNGKLDLSGLELKLDRLTEWSQMFADGWRITRDFFYDPEMHGYDWPAMRDKYAVMLPYLGHRSELDFLLGEMMSELEAGHTYVTEGDEPRVERVEGGKLGAELELDAASGRFRVSHIYRGENWDEAFRSPLTEPGVGIEEGHYILAIDGVDLRHPENPYRLLENKAGRPVTLVVSETPDAAGAREVLVRPIADEEHVRYIDWVKSRMELTERLSGGRVGYIHLPDTAIDGNRMLQKLFYGQADKEALIIDDRYNGGGFIPDVMLEYFERKTRSYWAQRGAPGFRTPGFAHNGPKAMLINGYSSSGGDALPYYFRQSDLGPLIGTRTWGGLIGISGAPPLADGGTVLPPTFRIYDREGKWVVENYGVEPDIEVYDLPEEIMAGRDPSIEKAVEVLLEALETEGYQHPDRPVAPDLND